MTDPVQPATPPSDQEKKSGDALILTPISIARARHASTHGPSVIAETKQAAETGPQPPAQSGRTETAGDSNKGGWQPASNSCLFFLFLSGALIVGGLIGGIMGGGLMLWANNAGGLTVLAASTPTPTPTASPTPLPVETVSPTPTPEPVATLSVEDTIASVIPSVVTVINQQTNSNIPGALYHEGRVVGSGVIVDARGYIATNNHVVDTPRNLRIVLSDGRELPAELVAANPAEDLAILKIGLTNLPTIEWANNGQLRPGQSVYAIGSPLGDFPSSVSFGIISGLNRALEIDKYVIDGLIQTDAAINRGSSGGPLIDAHGKVVGINTFIIRESEERGIAEGIAFAIPAETAKSLLIPWIAAHTGESVPIPASEASGN